MSEDTELLKKRFVELAKRSDGGGYFTFTDFLGLVEQSALAECTRELRRIPITLFGGVPGAERVMARFGSPDELGYDEPFPISIIKITPKQQKFADRLTHRDFLGSLMNLGIERETLGDIAIIDNVGYLFSKAEISEFILSSLSKVRHTDVICTLCDTLPEGELYRTEERRVQISSERLDAVVAKLFNLSREDAQSYFKKRLVFVNGRQCESVSYQPKEGEKVSVRTLGRFIWCGYESTSKKGKLNCKVLLYV